MIGGGEGCRVEGEEVRDVSAGRGTPPGERTAFGRRQEDLAVRFLQASGLTVLERNVRLGHDEIDVVARDGEELVFVEVRSRQAGGVGSPEGSVGRVKRRRLIRAAARWLDERGHGGAECRFDVVAIVVDAEGKARLRHWPGAFVLR